jgi:type VI secretion system protein ImpF
VVTEIASRDRLQPPLLDRLSDDDPTNSKESADKRVLSLTQLKASVLRDLAWLLNTTALLDADATLHTPAGTSVVNYGLPALAGNSVSSVDIKALETLIYQAIATFEPRILRHTLRVKARVGHGEMNHNALRTGAELPFNSLELDNLPLYLRGADGRKQLGVSLKSITGNKYTETHQIGSWAKANGYDGILAPSARNPTGSNLISIAGF